MMVSFMAPPTAVDGVTLQNVAGSLSVKDGGIGTTQLANLAVTSGKLAQAIKDSLTIPKVASGASSSGSAGTAVASITAAAGNRLTAIACAVTLANAANTHARVTATYSDDSTETEDFTTIGSTQLITGAISTRTDASGTVVPVDAFPGMATLAVKSIAVTTLNTGTGARTAAICALEVTV